MEEERPLRKGNLEARVVIRRRRDVETEEDWDVEDVVDGEFMKLGVSLTSKFWESLNRRMKEGMVEGEKESGKGMDRQYSQ